MYPPKIQTAQTPGLQAAPDPNDPFTAIGGGTNVNGNWIPNNNPTEIARQQALGGPAPAAPAPAALAAPAPSAPAATPAAPAMVNTPATVGAQTAQGAPTTVASAFQQALVNRLAPQDISATNPAIKGSIDANRLAESRGLSRTREALAERAAATGQTGAQEIGLRQAIGESAGRQGAFEGNALFGLQQQQNANLSNALGLGGSMLDSQSGRDLSRYGMDQEAALQREGYGLSRYGMDTDAELRRQALAQQGSLGGRELDIRNQLGQGNLGLGYAGLLQGGEQFRQGLGANLGIESARLNQDALIRLLGGL